MSGINEVDGAVVTAVGYDDLVALKTYTGHKLAVTQQLQFLERLFQVRGVKDQESRCHELLTKLAEDRFTLAVVGQFKRGKSSLMNALIGGELLPTGLLPLTSAITILRFGPRQRLVVKWMNSSLEYEKPLSALREFVTEQGNPGNRKQVRAVYVETNSTFLRRGLELVDTPGIGSAIEANTATTEAFIPHCDAVVFVTAVDAPMTESELGFLRRLRHDVKKVFCVVNKTDLLDEPQLSQVVEFVRSQIISCLGPQALIFSVSARSSLSIATTRENTVDSVAALRNALATFLSSERTNILLRVVIERAQRLLANAQTDIAAECRLASAPQVIRERQKILVITHFRRVDQIVAPRLESLAADLVRSVIHAQVAELRRRFESAVTAFADAAIHARIDNRWKLTGHVVTTTTQLASATAQQELNQWLAARRDDALAGIADGASDLLRALREGAIENTVSMGIEETSLSSLDSDGGLANNKVPRNLCVTGTPWLLKTPPWMRYMPIAVVCRPLRRWLRLHALEYTAQLEVMAVETLNTFMTDQIKNLHDAIEAGLRSREQGLLAAIASAEKGNDGNTPNPSPEEQSKIAGRIQDALMSVLASITGQIDGTRQIPFPACDKSETQQTAADIFRVSIGAVEVLDDLRFAGCPICRRLKKILFNVLAAWQYRIAVDDAAQQWYAQSFGFCPVHTWQLASIASPQGLSRGYPALTQRLVSGLRAFHPDSEITGNIMQLLASANSCPLCGLLADAERQYLQNLAAILESAAGQQRYSASRGVCLRHLPGLLALANGAPGKRFILDEAASHLAMLSEDMQSFALKHGALRRQLINENEESALTAALEKVAGVQSICFPWQFYEIV